MRGRVAAGVALVAAVAVFAGVFVVTQSLLWSPILAGAAALGLYLMIDGRRPHEVSDDEYEADADRKVEEALRAIREIRKQINSIQSPSARHLLQQSCDYVPELLDRVKKRSPNSLYSSASQMGAHVASLAGVVTQYLDIQRNPNFYTNPTALMQGGETAFQRFAEFTVDSLRLVNSGDIAQYQANLETVAPPKLPSI